MLDKFGKVCQRKWQGPKKCFNENKNVPIVILCRMHRLSNYGDLFLTISWTSQFSWFGGPGGSWPRLARFLENWVNRNAKVQKKQLVWWKPKLFPFQFCAGCTEYQIMGTLFWWFRGHLNFHDLGVLGDPTSVLVGSVPSGGYVSPKSPSWKREVRYFLEFNK